MKLLKKKAIPKLSEGEELIMEYLEEEEKEEAYKSAVDLDSEIIQTEPPEKMVVCESFCKNYGGVSNINLYVPTSVLTCFCEGVHVFLDSRNDEIITLEEVQKRNKYYNENTEDTTTKFYKKLEIGMNGKEFNVALRNSLYSSFFNPYQGLNEIIELKLHGDSKWIKVYLDSPFFIQEGNAFNPDENATIIKIELYSEGKILESKYSAL
jgi:hypothetical protein